MSESLSALLRSLPAGTPLIRYRDQCIGATELQRLSLRAASGLQPLGVRPGDRVALWLPNTPAWLILFFACARLGAIAVSVNTRFRAHEVQDIASRAGCKVLVTWPGFKAIDFMGILGEVDPTALSALEHLVVYQEAEDTTVVSPHGKPVTRYSDLIADEREVAADGTPDARCIIFTTSGTTKAPKFVCHQQQAVTQHAREVASAFAFTAADSLVLQALPLCGVFGFTQAIAALAAGCPMIMLPIFDATEAVACVQQHKVTHMCGVDDMIDRMLAVAPQSRPFPSLRHFDYARFNPALEDIVTRAEHRGVVMRGLYGMSEIHALYAVQPLAAPATEREKGGGRLVSPSAEVRVRDPETGRLLPPLEHGEIEVRGPSVMAEYFNDPVATAAAFTADGFFKTGDLGYLETDGRFCYLTRLGDVLRLAGFLTSPQEIEAVLDEHPQVASSQAVGVMLEQQLSAVAFVIAKPGNAPTETELRGFCQQRLASYKVPRRVFAIEAFPTTLSANGTKIQRTKLRDLAAELIAQGG